eukprot:TRINITY_DN17602_c0_g1_i1.p1 TRINITY_DN17602_c0_g1~~TRINITY_DN17602_c0_g1_i1.p1  ORF type:complete len:427 (-),score=90.10 TRINITY_DN17602_c0_g1_i1:51-1331(-)
MESLVKVKDEPSKVVRLEQNLLYFKGDNSSFVDCGKFKGCCDQFEKGMTVEAEILVKGDASGHILNVGGGWEDNGFSLFLYERNIRVELQNTKIPKKTVLDNPFHPSLSWVHIAFTWERQSGEMIVYIDKIAQQNREHHSHSICLEGAPNICIGMNLNHHFPFHGFIRNVAIWSRVLDPLELGRNTTLLGSSDHSLTAYWPLNEGAGEVANCWPDGTLVGRISEGQWTNSHVIPAVEVPKPDAIAEWYGRKCKFSNVAFNGVPSTSVVVLPNAPLQLSFDYSAHWNYNSHHYCPGCVVQLYYGMATFWSKGFVKRGVHQHKGKEKYTFNAPSSPGYYYITMNISLMYDYMRVYHNNTPENAFALVHVISGKWSPEQHGLCPESIRRAIYTVLLMAGMKDGRPYHPEAGWWKLPKDTLYDIFSLLCN